MVNFIRLSVRKGKRACLWAICAKECEGLFLPPSPQAFCTTVRLGPLSPFPLLYRCLPAPPLLSPDLSGKTDPFHSIIPRALCSSSTSSSSYCNCPHRGHVALRSVRHVYRTLTKPLLTAFVPRTCNRGIRRRFIPFPADSRISVASCKKWLTEQAQWCHDELPMADI
ncbi:unnamed protein product [Staurois parvus]|uniref:Uncharacterized protein n=1 Tax=Staurois parvus TaxID=386267 RepID=A0ABN9DFH5_9NEOB|nr:unnamed protein product [Staurois parvus]